MGNRVANPNETAPPTSSDREPAASKGTVLGEYEVVEHLGTGGFGHVYSVVHTIIGKRAALKVLHAEHSRNRTQSSRFVTEARAVNKIGHAGIVDVFAIGELPDGRKFLAMELLEGESLGLTVRRRGLLPAAEVLSILRPVAEALDAAHAAGIIHRDLKPDNIFMSRGADRALRPKLLDFGIAKLRVDAPEVQTQTGQALGTPLYMAPEQWRGRSVDHRADIYSLGVVAYEIATGRFPFRGSSLGDIMVNVCTTEPTPATRVAPHLPGAADAAFSRILAKDPNDRPSSAAEALALLSAAFEGARAPSPAAPRLIADDVATRIVPVIESNGPDHVLRVSPNEAVEPGAPTMGSVEVAQSNDLFASQRTAAFLAPQAAHLHASVSSTTSRGRWIAAAGAVVGLLGLVAYVGYTATGGPRTTRAVTDPVHAEEARLGSTANGRSAPEISTAQSSSEPQLVVEASPSATATASGKASSTPKASTTKPAMQAPPATATARAPSLTPSPNVSLPVTER